MGFSSIPPAVAIRKPEGKQHVLLGQCLPFSIIRWRNLISGREGGQVCWDTVGQLLHPQGVLLSQHAQVCGGKLSG